MISKPQITLLHVAKGKLNMSDDTYRQVLVRIAGVTTSTDLDREGFEAVMGFFEYCGFQPIDKTAPRYGERPGMASFPQIELIRELWREIHRDRACDDEALAGWLRKYQKVDSLRFLTVNGARKVITAFKAWKARAKAA